MNNEINKLQESIKQLRKENMAYFIILFFLGLSLIPTTIYLFDNGLIHFFTS